MSDFAPTVCQHLSCIDSEQGIPVIQTSDESGVVTLINVFTVDPADQQRLVDLLTRATDGFVSHAPGFMSAALHSSIDGTKVTMYAQWRSAEDYQAMRQDPGPRPFLEEALTIAKFEPGMYEIVRTFRPTGS
jgi:quinol monooxygenase YgiN